MPWKCGLAGHLDHLAQKQQNIGRSDRNNYIYGAVSSYSVYHGYRNNLYDSHSREADKVTQTVDRLK